MPNTREKLIELLKYANAEMKKIPGPFNEWGDFADVLIANGVTVQEWISVKDRLPTKEDAKIMGEYLPAIQKGQKPNVWKWTEVAKHPQYFTHWMPLPQPPKGE